MWGPLIYLLVDLNDMWIKYPGSMAPQSIESCEIRYPDHIFGCIIISSYLIHILRINDCRDSNHRCRFRQSAKLIHVHTYPALKKETNRGV